MTQAVLSITILALLGFLALGPAGSQPAFAHNQVTTVSPEPDERVTASPVDITIQTSDMLLDLEGQGRGFAITVTDANGLYYGDGCVSVVDTTMSTSVALGEPGTYAITYQYVSADGHSLSDRYTFSFEPAESHFPAQGKSAAAPVCGQQSSEAPEALIETEPETAPLLVAEEPSVDPTSDVNIALITAGAAVAILAGVGAVILLRRGKPSSP